MGAAVKTSQMLDDKRKTLKYGTLWLIIGQPSNPSNTSHNFSPKYHCLNKHEGHENRENEQTERERG